MTDEPVTPIPSRDIDTLLALMSALRRPGTGCPWDLEQTFQTIAPYTIEEAYEVVDAIARDDMTELRDELGDLLLQVVFHAELAREAQLFDFGAVVEAITAKLIRRHPHVFGAAGAMSSDEVKRLWDTIKSDEKKQRGGGAHLAGIATALPAVTRALKLQQKAAKVGFDWNDARLVLAKLREEIEEIEAAIAEGEASAIAGEVGDLMFVVVNLARHVGADPEAALRATNAKFERRFGFIEAELARQGKSLAEATLAEMDALWTKAKHLEKGRKGPSEANAS
jgi:ATP diphosphatase